MLTCGGTDGMMKPPVVYFLYDIWRTCFIIIFTVRGCDFVFTHIKKNKQMKTCTTLVEFSKLVGHRMCIIFI